MYGFSQNIEKHKPNEIQGRMHSFGIRFLFLCGNQTFQNLSLIDSFAFFYNFGPILDNKWPNSWHLNFFSSAKCGFRMCLA